MDRAEQPETPDATALTIADTAAPSSAKDTLALTVPVTERPGDWLGRYKLLQVIGEGGCGVVYMAEQEQPVRRRVALKVIKLGMDTKSVMARFEAERQALALMDHPNIARVLDAGASDTGRPFFVMELVRGVKLTDYCDQNKLSTEERLKLFIQVCQAIQHAHQKGIIHRDIKPSNILVTMHDGVPVPKVIDFGIAKATQGRLVDQTLFTAYEQFVGTPAYMSPEQAELSGLDIDTRSDIYALGVLLYELLTGKTPFDTQALLACGLDKLRQTIREKEPERPSTRLRAMVIQDLSTAASRRQTDPPKLIHLVRGDLDWIVMKTLEKDRTRRYETANGLAMDVLRYLNDEPVLARPPSSTYRLQKLIRRNRAVVAGVGAVCLALVAGLGLSLHLYLGERDARQRAMAAELEQARLRRQAEDALAVQARLQDRAHLADKLSAGGRLISEGHYDEAEQLLYQVPDPAAIPFLNNLAMARARAGDWPRASTNFSRMIELEPSEPTGYLFLAPLLVQAGELESYRQLRHRMLQQFPTLHGPVTAQRLLKACLLQPIGEADWDSVERLDKTMETTAAKRLFTQQAFRVTRGLFAYRLREYDKALGFVQNMPSGPQANPNLNAQACLVSAMSLWRLDRIAEARAALRRCAPSPADKPVKGKNREFGPGWNEAMFSEALLWEAKALIETTDKASDSGPPQ